MSNAFWFSPLGAVVGVPGADCLLLSLVADVEDATVAGALVLGVVVAVGAVTLFEVNALLSNDCALTCGACDLG